MKVALPDMTMQYRSVAELNADIVAWLPTLPRDLSLVVGIPRSGLLAANLIALHLNLPLADLDGFIANRTLGGGERIGERTVRGASSRPKVLIVDDSYDRGTAMATARQLLSTSNRNCAYYFAAIYVSPGTGSAVDYFASEVAQPRAFEWNIMHHRNLIPNCCMDIDGVLCRDPLETENDDGAGYVKFLTEVPPRYIPTYKVAYLVTSRLEKYRPQTEAWLAQHQIPYGQLRMLDLPNAQERRRLGCYGSFKASVYRSTETVMFYESSIGQAREIANRTGKFVFCTDTRQMIQPRATARSRWFVATMSKRLLRKTRSFLGQT